MSDYNISEASTLDMMRRIRGGSDEAEHFHIGSPEGEASPDEGG